MARDPCATCCCGFRHQMHRSKDCEPCQQQDKYHLKHCSDLLTTTCLRSSSPRRTPTPSGPVSLTTSIRRSAAAARRTLHVSWAPYRPSKVMHPQAQARRQRHPTTHKPPPPPLGSRGELRWLASRGKLTVRRLQCRRRQQARGKRAHRRRQRKAWMQQLTATAGPVHRSVLRRGWAPRQRCLQAHVT